MKVRSIPAPDMERPRVSPRYVERPLPDAAADAARWDDFCRTIEDHILTVRAEETDAICATCGSSTPEIATRKWCPRCQSLLITDRFARNLFRHDGLNSFCKACESVRGKEYRRKVARGVRRKAS